MKFFFDICTPLGVVVALRALDLDESSELIHHSETTLARDVADPVWMRWVRDNGCVAITNDRHIYTHPANRAALHAAQIVTFATKPSIADQKLWDQGLIVLRAWPAVKVTAQNARSGECFYITVNSKIESHNLKK